MSTKVLPLLVALVVASATAVGASGALKGTNVDTEVVPGFGGDGGRGWLEGLEACEDLKETPRLNLTPDGPLLHWCGHTFSPILNSNQEKTTTKMSGPGEVLGDTEGVAWVVPEGDGEVYDEVNCTCPDEPKDDKLYKFGSVSWYTFAGASLGIVLLAGLMAGLTMGFVSLDPTYIKILERTGTDEQKRMAKKVAPFVKRHHLVLVTLLLGNSLANEALPIFLNKIVNEVGAILLSVTFILVFGEILPSALFTGPKQLRIASALTPVLWFFMFLLFIIAWPISFLLDTVLGHEHGLRYRRTELKEFIKLQAEPDKHIQKSTSFRSSKSRLVTDMAHVSAKASSTGESVGFSGVIVLAKRAADRAKTRIATRKAADEAKAMEEPLLDDSSSDSDGEREMESHMLTSDEVKIISGVLDMTHKTAHDIMVPAGELFMLSTDDVLDYETMTKVMESTHSRIPVYRGGNREHVLGVLLVKLLIRLDPDDKTPVSDVALLPIIAMGPETALYDALDAFQTGQGHLAVVTNNAVNLHEACLTWDKLLPDTTVLGIVTLEDILEELLQEEIEDESDMLASDGRIHKWRSKRPKELRRDLKTAVRRLAPPKLDEKKVVPPRVMRSRKLGGNGSGKGGGGGGVGEGRQHGGTGAERDTAIEMTGPERK